AIAALHAEREQSRGDLVRTAAQIVPGEALIDACEDRRVTGAVARAGAIEELRDRHVLERIVARPGHIGERALRAQMVVCPAAQEGGTERIARSAQRHLIHHPPLMPAKAGIQGRGLEPKNWIPASAGISGSECVGLDSVSSEIAPVSRLFEGMRGPID